MFIVNVICTVYYCIYIYIHIYILFSVGSIIKYLISCLSVQFHMVILQKCHIPWAGVGERTSHPELENLLKEGNFKIHCYGRDKSFVPPIQNKHDPPKEYKLDSGIVCWILFFWSIQASVCLCSHTCAQHSIYPSCVPNSVCIYVCRCTCVKMCGLFVCDLFFFDKCTGINSHLHPYKSH